MNSNYFQLRWPSRKPDHRPIHCRNWRLHREPRSPGELRLHPPVSPCSTCRRTCQAGRCGSAGRSSRRPIDRFGLGRKNHFPVDPLHSADRLHHAVLLVFPPACGSGCPCPSCSRSSCSSGSSCFVRSGCLRHRRTEQRPRRDSQL